jgi:sporulation protein YqfC
MRGVDLMPDKLNKIRENIAQQLELPRDIIMNLPRIIINSDSEITIENHKGIILFEEKNVKIDSNIGVISINGDNFEVLFIGGSTLILSGKFKSVIYEENNL